MTRPLSLTFHGAARTVTGSCHEFQLGGTRLLVDCGMFQGSRTLEGLNAEIKRRTNVVGISPSGA